jgi:ribosomal protein L3 glutamine methyltransferase
VKIDLPSNAGACVDVLAECFGNADLFYGHGTDNAGMEAQWLVTAVLTQDGVTGITENTPISPVQQSRMADLASLRIIERLPLAYLLREAWFAGHCFYVDERVLVPRSPVAELVDCGFEPLLQQPPERILDLCCGSGCIGISCALAFPDSEVVLADLSEDALAVAQINIDQFSLGNRVTPCRSDLYDRVTGTFDLVVCNPPYVPEEEFRELPPEYHREPVMGLISKQAGLDIPLRVLEQTGRHLEDHGLLILETGYNWPALDKALPDVPLLWLEFEHGGEGVCALTAQQLRHHFTAKEQ